MAPLAADHADTVDPARAAAAAEALPAWDRAAAALEAAVAAVVVAVVAAGAGRRSPGSQGVSNMNSKSAKTVAGCFFVLSGAVCVWSGAEPALRAAQKAATKAGAPATAASTSGAKLFASPQQAADALIAAAGKFDVSELMEIFGPDGRTIVFSGEFAQDRQHATDFAAEAREKTSVSVDTKGGNRAFLLVGKEDWPFPVPIVKRGTQWFFDGKAGQQELLYRRIGANELDAIEICYGYVEAQHEYALKRRSGYDVNQYAQRIISTPGTQDGLAWKSADGTWDGPIGENIAKAIEQGYTNFSDPYHGYFFKILKGQGPAAPLGNLDFVVKGAMIGGFALVAAPAQYGITGVRTFIVSHDGVVYEKDLGPKSLAEFEKMELFNPDMSWTPVEDAEEDVDSAENKKP